ncbi:MAG: DeoR/GlpR family DNA-binding transcription regulator [bacterium]
MGLKFAERKKKILDILSTENKVEVTKLGERLGVSEVTVRRDLSILEKQGLLAKTYGGAIKQEQTILESMCRDKVKKMPKEKEAIGKYAAGLLKDGDVIFLDTGTTTAQIARNLKNRSNITVVTNSILVMLELRTSRNISTILLGGNCRVGSFDLSGPLAEKGIESFRADKAFLGTDGISISAGVTSRDIYTAKVTELMCRLASEVIVVTDYTKIGKNSFSKYADIKDIHKLITDKNADKAYLEKIRKMGVEVITV